MARLCLLFALALALGGCLVVEPTYDRLPPGPYRGVFYLDGRQSERREPDRVAANYDLDDVPQAELPVEIEVSYGPDSALQVTFINGAERLPAARVEFVRLITNARDSVTIHMPLNDAYITGYHEDGTIEGYYVDPTRAGDYRIPFAAFHGVGYRFTDLRKAPATDLSGRWAATFGVEDSSGRYPAIAEFVQQGNDLTGTFLTETGDYRYLSGTIQGERAYLSTFDGGHVFLFVAKLLPDSTLLGAFRSGTHHKSIWVARRDPDARLRDPAGLTRLGTPGAAFDPSVFDPQTERVRPLSALATDPSADVTLVTLMGSWCPNCRDEAVYLDSLHATLPPGRVRVVGLAFERHRDTTRALVAVQRFRETLDLDFPIYVAGFADKAEATRVIGALDTLRSFPTLLALDRERRIVYTHTGFSGPATSEYGSFARAFAKTVQDLLAR